MKAALYIFILLSGLYACTDIPPEPGNPVHTHFASDDSSFLYIDPWGDSVFGPVCSLYFPKSFAPEKMIGKPVNNYYLPVGHGFIDGEFKVFNSSGVKLHETTFTNGDLEPNNNTKYTEIGWDGTYNGKPMPMGTYRFTCSFTTSKNEIKSLEGTFSLIR